MIPSVLVPLSSLPLTPNGKVDRGAPDPFAAAERPRHETIPPPSRTHVDPGFEEEVAAIWRAVLGVSAVRADDDFFQLGGHSLAAIHMLAEVHRRTGKRISSAVLFSAPTVRGVADALRRAPSRPTFRSLIPIQAKGRRPPLFCVHGGGGHVFWYKALARRLGDDQPFYGLQHRIEDDGHVHTRTVEDMATHYLDEIREAFPRGPYYLAGASFGGKVAYEMARRLRESGETVALLAMFDSWGPDYPRLRDDVSDLGRRARAAYLRVQHHAGALWLLDDTSQRMAYVRQKLHWGYMESLDSVGRAAVAVARWTYVKRGREGSIPRDLRESPGFIKEASLAYEPLPYDGDVVLFRSLVQPPGAVRDDWLGWRDLVRGELIVIEVPGMHAAMVVEPRVRFLVAELRPILEAAQARYG
ncbi:MAG: thioesterase domain-containing protein [Polyangiaceae bacterium]